MSLRRRERGKEEEREGRKNGSKGGKMITKRELLIGNGGSLGEVHTQSVSHYVKK